MALLDDGIDHQIYFLSQGLKLFFQDLRYLTAKGVYLIVDGWYFCLQFDCHIIKALGRLYARRFKCNRLRDNPNPAVFALIDVLLRSSRLGFLVFGEVEVPPHLFGPLLCRVELMANRTFDYEGVLFGSKRCEVMNRVVLLEILARFYVARVEFVLWVVVDYFVRFLRLAGVVHVSWELARLLVFAGRVGKQWLLFEETYQTGVDVSHANNFIKWSVWY